MPFFSVLRHFNRPSDTPPTSPDEASGSSSENSDELSRRRRESGSYAEEEDHIINLQHRVELSSAIPHAEADIVLLADKDMSGGMSGTISKEGVPLVSKGLLD